jgi:transketolase
MTEQEMNKRLSLIAATIRKDVVRMTGLARAGAVASSLSIVDILTYLFWSEMNIFPEDPHAPSRDRFVLGKGHGCAALYAALAHRGFFGREELWNYCKLGAMLQGNPELGRTPGIDASAGSCGAALGLAAGMALSFKTFRADPRIFCLIGDGELQEGTTWESLLLASHYGLDNLTLLIDNNQLQEDGKLQDIISIEPLAEKLSSFGWGVTSADGHDFESIFNAFSSLRQNNGTPSVIIFDTCSGKGVSFIEEAGSRGNNIVLSRERVDAALREISFAAEKMEEQNHV